MRHRTRVSLLATILLALAAAVNDASQLTGSPGGRAGDTPISAARFGISIDGVQVAVFSELVALTEGWDRQSLALGSDGTVLFPGQRQPPTIVLKRGKNNNVSIREWFDAAMTGDIAARRSCTLTMYDYDGKPVARYYLENAWPSKIEIGGFSIGSRDGLAEIVTLVADTIREDPSR